MKLHKLLIGDSRVETREAAEVINPYNSRPIAKVSMGGIVEINAAITAAQKAFRVTRTMSGYDTSGLLKRAVHGIIRNRQKLADTIVAEAGKPLVFAEQEVDRTITTFGIAAEEATRIGGELLPVDIDSRSAGRIAITKRFPLGVVAGIFTL